MVDGVESRAPEEMAVCLYGTVLGFSPCRSAAFDDGIELRQRLRLDLVRVGEAPGRFMNSAGKNKKTIGRCRVLVGLNLS